MIGSRLGNWVIDKEIGHGGMGRVYLAHEETGSRQGAVKVLARELAMETGFLERFRREIDVLSQLDHPNIVRFYESGLHDGLYFYAMEYVDGENYEQILQNQGRLPWREVLDLALQICPALKHAHDRGIVHRDLKPPNLLRSTAGVVKLTDFGIAKVFASRHLTNTGGVVGTADYLSPEQASGKPATKRSDLYSFGIVLYTLLTGKPPFDGNTSAELLHKHLYGRFDPPQKIVPDIPYEFDQVICELLEKDPSKRPGDGLILHRHLDSLRRKLERKSQHTLPVRTDEQTVADTRGDLPDQGPGAATLMSRLLRRELELGKQGNTLSQLFRRPVVVVPLFLICVGLLIWGFYPRRGLSQDELFQRAQALMVSSDPEAWDRAWNDYIEPLQKRYPDNPYQDQVRAYRVQIQDHAAQRRALAAANATRLRSEAQRFYQRGLRYCQEGDIEAARRVWQNIIRSFSGIDSEARWVHLARECLAALTDQTPSAERRLQVVQKCLEHARQLRDEGKREQAEEIWRGLEELYAGDASAKDVLSQIQLDRAGKKTSP
jgi:serine/threonine-protein kinase